MYYWINTSLEYQATNEHFDCIVVSQNICIRETVKKYILNDYFMAFRYVIIIHIIP